MIQTAIFTWQKTANYGLPKVRVYHAVGLGITKVPIQNHETYQRLEHLEQMRLPMRQSTLRTPGAPHSCS